MEFAIKSGYPEKQRTACVVVGVFEPRRLSSAAARLDEHSQGYLSSILRRGDMEGKLGQTLLLPKVSGIFADRILLVGCGREREFNDSAYRRVTAITANLLNETGAMDAVSYLTDLNVRGRDIHWKVRQAVEVTEAALYRFEAFKSKKEEVRRPLRRVVLIVPSRRELPIGERAQREGVAIAKGMRFAKDLANLPANVCTPSYLAEEALKLAGAHEALEVKVLELEDMEKLHMGALLAVARGSRQPPKLIVLEYQGGKKGDRPFALVGKGVTFDAGGISLKPAQHMDEMKFDMSGAAAVLGTFVAALELKLPVNLVGVIPATENMPDGNATRPGDIITSMSGQTIEVLNTDAEGRLILCDALTYAERYQPEAVIDVATLTGACIVALGHEATGVLGNHHPLVNDLLQAARESGDRAWELPLWDEYQELIKSPFADMANIGPPREAGTIVGAVFLSRFAKGYRWAHLDIAGTAWQSGEKKGATGRPVPLLTQFLLDRAGA